MTIYTIIEKLPEWVESDVTASDATVIGYFLDIEVAEEAIQLLRNTEEEKAKEEFQGEWRKWAKRYLLTEKAVSTSAEDFVEDYLAENERVMNAVSDMTRKLQNSTGIDLFAFDLEEELAADMNLDEDEGEIGFTEDSESSTPKDFEEK